MNSPVHGANRGPAPLRVGGLEPLTTVDFPERLAAVVFCQGCPWRCRYCHNPHLQAWESLAGVNWDSCLEFLRQRLGFLEAVVFSGGEPTAQEGLLPAIAQVRDLGFAIGLHTAGMFPDRLERVLPLVDWVGFDVKAPFDARYEQITGRRDSARRARQSLEILQRASVPFQVRTTVDESVLNEDALLVVDEDLKGRGLPPTVRQTCRERSG